MTGRIWEAISMGWGSSQSVKVRSIVGILPALAVAVVDDAAVERVRTVHKRAADLLDERRAEATRLKEEGVRADRRWKKKKTWR